MRYISAPWRANYVQRALPMKECFFCAAVKGTALSASLEAAYAKGRLAVTSLSESLFGGPPRQPEARITQREMAIAASIQQVTEEAVLR
ncbi:MAG: hypothetical protein HGA24_08350, partial [Candidatus Aminicenantes bacterium]|nr:hypothetical protein [Candidatus Aminicenantes bacterium]